MSTFPTAPTSPSFHYPQATPAAAECFDRRRQKMSMATTDAPSYDSSGQLEPLISSSPSPAPIRPQDISSTPRPALLPQVIHKQRYSCKMGCTRSFASPKDLRRHYHSKAHAEEATKSYECRCGYSTPRKDHYRRHLSNISQGKTCTYHRPRFRCICEKEGAESNHLNQIQHVNVCQAGRGVAGRPKKTNG